MKALGTSVLFVLLLALAAPARGADIHKAAKAGDVAKVRAMIAKDKSIVRKKDKYKWTALHEAAAYEKAEVVKLLVKSGAELDARTVTKCTALHYASMFWDRRRNMKARAEIAKVLLEAGAKVNLRDNDGCSPLHWAVTKANLPVVEVLLKHGADKSAVSLSGYSMTHAGVNSGKMELLRRFPPKAGDRNGLTRDNHTFLEYAANNRNTEMVKYFLDRGANPNIRDSDGRTALHPAAKSGKLEIVKALLAKGADPTVASRGGWTPLHAAVCRRQGKVVELLLARKVPVNIVNEDGETPFFHNALDHGSEEMARLLLQAGAYTRIRDRKGRTAADVAKAARFSKVLALIAQWEKLHPDAKKSEVPPEHGIDRCKIEAIRRAKPQEPVLVLMGMGAVDPLLLKSVQASMSELLGIKVVVDGTPLTIPEEPWDFWGQLPLLCPTASCRSAKPPDNNGSCPRNGPGMGPAQNRAYETYGTHTGTW